MSQPLLCVLGSHDIYHAPRRSERRALDPVTRILYQSTASSPDD